MYENKREDGMMIVKEEREDGKDNNEQHGKIPGNCQLYQLSSIFTVI